MVGFKVKRLVLLLLLLLSASSLLFSATLPNEDMEALTKAVNQLYFPLSGDELYCNIIDYEERGNLSFLTVSLSGTERVLVYERGKHLEKNIYNAFHDVLLYNPDFNMASPRLDYITARERSSISIEGKHPYTARFTLKNLEGTPIALYDIKERTGEAVIFEPVWIGSEMTGLQLEKTRSLELNGLVRFGPNGVSTLAAGLSCNTPIKRIKALLRVDTKELTFAAGLGTTLSLTTLTNSHFTLFEDGRLNASFLVGFDSLDDFKLSGGFTICYEHFINNHYFWGIGYERMASEKVLNTGIVMKVGYVL